MLVRNRRDRRRSGTAVVEMALVLPLFLTLILGQIESMRFGMVTQLLSVAAREGCRVAVVHGRTRADVQARVAAVLTGSGIVLDTVSPSPTNWATLKGGEAITLTLSVPFRDVSLFPSPYYFKDKNVIASATMSSERPVTP